MSELSLPLVQQKKDWTLTTPALNQLLTWLDEGSDSEGLRYLEMRRRLVSYFDRKNCLTPDELADETLNRVARRLEESVIETETPAKYCYIQARYVFMEYLRDSQKGFESLNDKQEPASRELYPAEADDERETQENMLSCLEKCTSGLETRSREIINRYYLGAGRTKIENRSTLAKELGITMNALAIRACRIRDKLEVCVRQCVAAE